MLILNFTHPLTEHHCTQSEEMAGKQIGEVRI